MAALEFDIPEHLHGLSVPHDMEADQFVENISAPKRVWRFFQTRKSLAVSRDVFFTWLQRAGTGFPYQEQQSCHDEENVSDRRRSTILA